MAELFRRKGIELPQDELASVVGETGYYSEESEIAERVEKLKWSLRR